MFKLLWSEGKYIELNQVLQLGGCWLEISLGGAIFCQARREPVSKLWVDVWNRSVRMSIVKCRIFLSWLVAHISRVPFGLMNIYTTKAMELSKNIPKLGCTDAISSCSYLQKLWTESRRKNVFRLKKLILLFGIDIQHVADLILPNRDF